MKNYTPFAVKTNAVTQLKKCIFKNEISCLFKNNFYIIFIIIIIVSILLNYNSNNNHQYNRGQVNFSIKIQTKTNNRQNNKGTALDSSTYTCSLNFGYGKILWRNMLANILFLCISKQWDDNLMKSPSGSTFVWMNEVKTVWRKKKYELNNCNGCSCTACKRISDAGNKVIECTIELWLSQCNVIVLWEKNIYRISADALSLSLIVGFFSLWKSYVWTIYCFTHRDFIFIYLTFYRVKTCSTNIV